MPVHQVGVPIIASVELYPHSNELSSSQGQSQLPIWFINPIIHGNPLPITILVWIRNQPPSKYPRLNTSQTQIKYSYSHMNTTRH